MRDPIAIGCLNARMHECVNIRVMKKIKDQNN